LLSLLSTILALANPEIFLKLSWEFPKDDFSFKHKAENRLHTDKQVLDMFAFFVIVTKNLNMIIIRLIDLLKVNVVVTEF